jgi:rubrerythrin
MRHKRHEPILPEALDEPFGPPPEEFFYRCPVCSEEMLVNEAIVDVTIGAVTFRGEYTGGMPIIGCPGCNGETMAYVKPEP